MRRSSPNRRKFLESLLFFATASFLFVPQIYAGTIPSGPVNVTAQIPAGLTLDMRIVDQLTNNVVPSLDFGELLRVGEEFRAKTFFKVYLTLNSVGDPCELTQIGTALTRQGGSETMPAGAFMVKPEYIEADNNSQPLPAGANVASVKSVVGTLLLYNDPTGSKRVLTCTYTLTGDPNTGATDVISISQKSGSYSGTIQFTLTTI